MSENSPEKSDSEAEALSSEDQPEYNQSQQESDYDDDEGDGNPDVPGAFHPIFFNQLQRRVGDMMNDHLKNKLDVSPSFQRGYVWDKAKASRLIESVLLNVPLPLIYTAKEEDGREVVIDGQQRLLTLFGFMKGEFPRDKKDFKLSGLKIMTDLNRKSFKQLDENIQVKIEEYLVQLINIREGSDSNVKFEIFERLNSGAVSLTAQELRNCIYRGSFNELLRQLAKHDNFRKAIGNESVMDRMKDAELILRFIAFWEKTYLKYPGGMRSFLNDFMNEHRNLSDEKAQKWTTAFKKSSDLCFTVFGPQSFRRYNVSSVNAPNGRWERTFNRALYDVVMWGFSDYEKSQIVPKADAIRSGLAELILGNSDFNAAITVGTGDTFRVKVRFDVWREKLKGIVQGTSPNPRLFSPELKGEMYEQSQECKICGQQIISIDDCEVDHIKPFAEGGKTERANAQLAHRYCNRAKGGHI